METTVIILCILLGVAVIVLGLVASLQILTGSKERLELQRLLKAKDLPEFVSYTQPEEEELGEDQNLVELEAMGEIINDRIEKVAPVAPKEN